MVNQNLPFPLKQGRGIEFLQIQGLIGFWGRNRLFENRLIGFMVVHLMASWKSRSSGVGRSTEFLLMKRIMVAANLQTLPTGCIMHDIETQCQLCFGMN
ncbi:MAG: hypothetical protein NTW75_16755 [Planctomycetales bacterium]|nr:hypothetical protein [Planctomycetales bacterium]